MMLMTTYSGLRVDPLNIRTFDISITDVARSLSLQCRYNGHLPSFYSVAEHCVRVAGILLEETGDSLTAMCGLLHDSTEAYLSDLPAPIKTRPEFDVYREIEDNLMIVMCNKFGLPSPIEDKDRWGEVWRVDHDILGWEAANIRTGQQDGWDHATARNRFVRCYADLGGSTTGEIKTVV
jgi:hypothetical protein